MRDSNRGAIHAMFYPGFPFWMHVHGELECFSAIFSPGCSFAIPFQSARRVFLTPRTVRFFEPNRRCISRKRVTGALRVRGWWWPGRQLHAGRLDKRKILAVSLPSPPLRSSPRSHLRRRHPLGGDARLAVVLGGIISQRVSGTHRRH